MNGNSHPGKSLKTIGNADRLSVDYLKSDSLLLRPFFRLRRLLSRVQPIIFTPWQKYSSLTLPWIPSIRLLHNLSRRPDKDSSLRRRRTEGGYCRSVFLGPREADDLLFIFPFNEFLDSDEYTTRALCNARHLPREVVHFGNRRFFNPLPLTRRNCEEACCNPSSSTVGGYYTSSNNRRNSASAAICAVSACCCE